MRVRTLVLLLAALAAGYLSVGIVRLGRPSAPRSAAEASVPGESVPSAPAAAPEPAAKPGESSGGPLPEDLTPEETRNIEIFRRASGSVVFITNIAYRRDFFTLDVFQIPQGNGSGFVWDKEGHIVTNYHVIEGGNAFSVTLADQSSYDAQVVGAAASKDLAVLKIDAPADKLNPLPLGRSQDLLVGQAVLALGNPFGLDHTLTVGIVSALGRELQAPNGRTIRDVIQTDAAINPGNSGGPLLDSRGRLIGVNSAIYSPSGASAGIGFAVPVDTVRRLVPQLIERGRPIQPGIGASLLSDAVAERFRLKGVVIYEVLSGSPAEKAGLQGLRADRSGRIVLGDRILAVDGKAVESGDDLMHAFETAGVGRSVTLRVDRDGRERDVTVMLVAIELGA